MPALQEFKEVVSFFAPRQAPGSVVLDLSCGSGLMTRRLVKSGLYSRVLAADLSPSMLGETALRFDREGLARPTLVRADASKLPLRSENVDGVHAGAALHCWTKLEEGLQEASLYCVVCISTLWLAVKPRVLPMSTAHKVPAHY
jgi:ubiquinone/menaquinone biosynthesis C-methylase UbiE